MTDTFLKTVSEFWQVGWRPMLEIAILWISIYQFYRLLRGTRGWAVVLGLTGVSIFVLTLMVVTNLLNLTVLSKVIGWLLFAMPFFMLIIFQPELRRIFAEFGDQPMFNTARRERENIEVLVRAMERLSKMRIGALVAVEQSIHLRGAVESGVELNCDASPEMLETIFFPNNAIHDGGVLIKGDRITYAACIFPLTQRQDLDKAIGTRHRAAIGLSEETDAVVIIVSEEIGSISYAYKGHLERGVTLNELRSFLSSVLVRRDQPRNWSEWLSQKRRRRKKSKAVPRKENAALDEGKKQTDNGDSSSGVASVPEGKKVKTAARAQAD
ncbi:MAG: diadenylate cyclase CdaA [Verrucomicrobiia bacterium]|jgi:diadenylate cyclase